MTSRRPYWCPKTTKRRPCWCPKPVLWKFNSFLMQTLSFVPINFSRCRPREWKHSQGNLSNDVFKPRTSTGSELFEIFGRYFENNFGQIVFTTVTTFRNTNLVTLRHIKREKPSLPVDVRRSKLNRVKTLKSPKRALAKMVQYHKFWTIAKKVSNCRRLIWTCSRSLLREVGAVIVVPFLVSMAASSAKSVAVCSVEKKRFTMFIHTKYFSDSDWLKAYA